MKTMNDVKSPKAPKKLKADDIKAARGGVPARTGVQAGYNKIKW